jgi:hypothetical protein
MSYATITSAAGTSSVIAARVRLPAWGIWAALVTLDRGDELTGAVTLALGDLSLVGTIRRGGAFVGRGQYRIFGGGDGWGKTIPATSYRNPQALLSTLAKDAAALVGERLVFEADGDLVVGQYVRAEGPASRALNTYAPARWWVEIDGTTHVGSRVATVAPSARVLHFDPDLGVVTAGDDASLVLPGQAFASGDVAGSVSTVFHDLDGSKLRTEVYLQ